MNADSFKDFILDQFHGGPDVECRRMFGGHGLYGGGRIFGIIFNGKLYFKTDARTRGCYVEAGMQPFRPRERQTLGIYWEVPVAVLENPAELTAWAADALAVAPLPSSRATVRRRNAPG